jgi:hypothetical protein
VRKSVPKEDPRIAPPVDEIAVMEAKVRRMREMGVTEWGDIKLGPAPAPAPRVPTAEEVREATQRKEEQVRDTLFAACHVKPAIRPVKRSGR